MYEEFMKFLKSFNTGDTITEEGDKESDDFFCLLQGKVGVYKDGDESEDNTEPVLVGEIDEKGSYFGEMSALIHEPRTATIKAMTPIKVLQFPGSMLPLMMQKQPKLAVKLAKAMAERLKGTTAKQKSLVMQREEIQTDATQQLLHAKQTFNQLLILLSAVQLQHQVPPMKNVIAWLTENKLLHGSKSRLKKDPEFIETLPEDLKEIVSKFFVAQESAGSK